MRVPGAAASAPERGLANRVRSTWKGPLLGRESPRCRFRGAAAERSTPSFRRTRGNRSPRIATRLAVTFATSFRFGVPGLSAGQPPGVATRHRHRANRRRKRLSTQGGRTSTSRSVFHRAEPRRGPSTTAQRDRSVRDDAAIERVFSGGVLTRSATAQHAHRSDEGGNDAPIAGRTDSAPERTARWKLRCRRK
jgi:hypothetical protein